VVKAYEEIEQMLRGIKIPAIIHQYQGNHFQTNRLLENEMIYFSVGKQIFNSSKKSLIENIPITRLFFETVTQVYSVQKVYEEYCNLFHLDLSNIQAQIRNNFEKFFHLIP
jgi:Tat protein secretion system quality control protein TatD with DNase activity